jgi:uncharacterized protein YhjY with autotransporter beta-barrel domain
MCTHLGGAASSGGVNVSANLGIATAGGEVSARKKKNIRDLKEDPNKKNEKAASGDDGAWGFVVTPQYGKNTRSETDLENGYRSNLSGLLVGVDYRFSDRLVLGTTIASTQDKATFFNGAGSLKTGNTTLVMYGTWLAGENISFDGYLGNGKISLDSQREINWATTINNGFFGTVTGNTTGRQTLAGLSVSLQKGYGDLNVSPFLNVDYVKTRINGYDENGTTTIEMHYGERNIASLTSSLGLRLDKSFSYDWGMLIPSVRLASVHEFQNHSQQIKNELVVTPGWGGFNVATDAPTRNYLNSGIGVVAALNRGTQLFLDYDKRSRDPLLNSWAVSIGVLIGN